MGPVDTVIPVSFSTIEFVISYQHRKTLFFDSIFSNSFLNTRTKYSIPELTWLCRNMGISSKVLKSTHTLCCPLLLGTWSLWLSSWDAHPLVSLHIFSPESQYSVIMWRSYGCIMTNVVGTLFLSSHGIPYSQLSLADPGAFHKKLLNVATRQAKEKPLSARQEGTNNMSSNLICIITSICSVDIWWTWYGPLPSLVATIKCHIGHSFQCQDLEFLCWLGLGKGPSANAMVFCVTGYSLNVGNLCIQLLQSAFFSCSSPML